MHFKRGNQIFKVQIKEMVAVMSPVASATSLIAHDGEPPQPNTERGSNYDKATQYLCSYA